MHRNKPFSDREIDIQNRTFWISMVYHIIRIQSTWISTSFFMMLPTPGSTVWSKRASHTSFCPCSSIRATALEWLKFSEHISKLSYSCTLARLSAASLSPNEMKIGWIYMRNVCDCSSNNCVSKYNKTILVDFKKLDSILFDYGTPVLFELCIL